MTLPYTDRSAWLKIASRSAVDIFATGTDPERFTGRPTGDYWPYRATTVSTAESRIQKAKYTQDRALKYCLLDDRPPGSTYLSPLRELAINLGVDTVVPAVHTGTSRQAVASPIEKYETVDLSTAPDFHLTLTPPIELTTACLIEKFHSPSNGLESILRPPRIALRYPSTEPTVTDLLEDLSYMHNHLPVDPNITVVDPPVGAELVTYLRRNPRHATRLILGSYSVSTATVTASNPPDLLSKKGEQQLRCSATPVAKLSSQLSFLLSSFVDDEMLQQAIYKSDIPGGTQVSRQSTLKESSPSSNHPQQGNTRGISKPKTRK